MAESYYTPFVAQMGTHLDAIQELNLRLTPMKLVHAKKSSSILIQANRPLRSPPRLPSLFQCFRDGIRPSSPVFEPATVPGFLALCRTCRGGSAGNTSTTLST